MMDEWSVCAVSDLHGNLPPVPPCDLLLIAGDLCPATDHRPAFQAHWFDTTFRRWVMDAPARKVFYIAGNHDFVFQEKPHLVGGCVPEWVLPDFQAKATYLQDSGAEWEGLKVWGSPWQPPFHDWAFNLPEAELEKKWALIPENTDILITHGPPHGYGDGVKYGEEYVGSPSLRERVEQVRPRLHVFGHVHEGRGVWESGGTVYANVTLLNELYWPVHEPWCWKVSKDVPGL